MKKLITIFLYLFIFQIASAQNEFITVWKPSTPSLNSPYAGITAPSLGNEIWLPVKGNNYTIHWEEIGYPSHQATLHNVTSIYQTLINFGIALNPNTQNATYRVKISDGNGDFIGIYFKDFDLFPNGNGIVGDVTKIINIEQWGSNNWVSMHNALAGCHNMDITATDNPNLSNTADISFMFQGCSSFIGNPTINNWDTSNITNLISTFSGCILFNQPLNNWDTSNVVAMGTTFIMAQNFNQPLDNWDTSKVITMTAMFNNARKFNQPIGNWDLSNNLDCEFMFSNAWDFNQPIDNWDTSNVTEMNNMFTNAKTFNQPIGSWDTSNVTIMIGMFQNALLFNQNIGNWDLSSLLLANNMFLNSGLNCQNYDRTLYGWSLNPATPNNINISSVLPMTYAHPAAVTARNYLINNKGWLIVGDTYDGECNSVLSTIENISHVSISIYPNPALDFIYIKNLKNTANYKISDASGRLLKEGKVVAEKVDVSVLPKGNYILQLFMKYKVESFKFIKK